MAVTIYFFLSIYVDFLFILYLKEMCIILIYYKLNFNLQLLRIHFNLQEFNLFHIGD